MKLTKKQQAILNVAIDILLETGTLQWTGFSGPGGSIAHGVLFITSYENEETGKEYIAIHEKPSHVPDIVEADEFPGPNDVDFEVPKHEAAKAD